MKCFIVAQLLLLCALVLVGAQQPLRRNFFANFHAKITQVSFNGETYTIGQGSMYSDANNQQLRMEFMYSSSGNNSGSSSAHLTTVIPDPNAYSLVIISQYKVPILYVLGRNQITGKLSCQTMNQLEPGGNPFTEDAFINAKQIGSTMYNGHVVNSYDNVCSNLIGTVWKNQTYFEDAFTGLPVAIQSDGDVLEYRFNEFVSLEQPRSDLFIVPSDIKALCRPMHMEKQIQPQPLKQLTRSLFGFRE